MLSPGSILIPGAEDPRWPEGFVLEQLARFPAVALLAPRQVGKTTLARQIAQQRTSLVLDLESPADRAKLQEPELFLGRQHDQLVILDQVQRLAGLFQVLRGVIDANLLASRRNGQFLLLGSADQRQAQRLPIVLAQRLSLHCEPALPCHSSLIEGLCLDDTHVRRR